MRFLLDEDLPPRVAEVARGLGVDARSVHELGRLGIPDREQLRFAAAEGWIFVTRNRDDFLYLNAEFYRTGEPHGGVLIVSRSLPGKRPERVAHALRRWAATREEYPESFGPYHVDFLSSEGTVRG